MGHRPRLHRLLLSLCLLAALGHGVVASGAGPLCTAPPGSPGEYHWEYYAAAPWLARSQHTTVTFQDRLWVLGGHHCRCLVFVRGGPAMCAENAHLNDVWQSPNGLDWTEVTPAAGWSPRYGHASLVFDGAIWVLGGIQADHTRLADVWYSTDGEAWFRATESAPWGARHRTAAVSFDGAMWLIGGGASSPFGLGDVWRSVDGADWNRVEHDLPFAGLTDPRALVFRDELWLFGTCHYRDGDGARTDTYEAWRSQDGVSWTFAAGDTSRPDYLYEPLAWDDTLWLFGKGPNYVWNSGTMNFWFSADGTAWTGVGGVDVANSAVDFLRANVVRGEILVTGGRENCGSGAAPTAKVFRLRTGRYHDIDRNRNNVIELDELLRLVQFFNSGGYRCSNHYYPNTYVAWRHDGGNRQCPPHSADHTPQDWAIGLRELMRVVQLFNAGGYACCPGANTEDGYCPVMR